MADLTTGDLALMRDDGMNGNASFVWIFALMMMMFGGRGVWGGNGGPGPMPAMQPYATADQVNQGFNNQQFQQLSLATERNNYETARLINEQTNLLSQQNNANTINAIQGFNQINLSIQNQTNVISQQLQALQAKIDSCCCEIKTQMLQQRLDDTQAQKVALENQVSNYNQSQYILGQMGRWVGWTPSGTQAATGA